MISIVLIEPENEGNVGAIARAMANFDLKNLVLIKPKCDHLVKEALDRAKHAKQILKKAKVKDFSCLEKFDYVIGTTSKIGTDYNIPRCPLEPEKAAEKIAQIKSKKIAIVFGREGIGLTNKEILKCDFTITIPSSKKYFTLNISHAAAVIFYELHRKLAKEKITSHIIPVSKEEKQQLMKMLKKVLDNMEFSTKEKKETQKRVWKRIIGKACLTNREAFALMGFFRKLL
ncbi:RNA methyltransferase [Candidatus Woesearchaeota archaeon]|nr:RNA methyltransferase [Candidatus Woesearchaeota archaeon]